MLKSRGNALIATQAHTVTVVFEFKKLEFIGANYFERKRSPLIRSAEERRGELTNKRVKVMGRG